MTLLTVLNRTSVTKWLYLQIMQITDKLIATLTLLTVVNRMFVQRISYKIAIDQYQSRTVEV
jgi:hypothetical protein